MIHAFMCGLCSTLQSVEAGKVAQHSDGRLIAWCECDLPDGWHEVDDGKLVALAGEQDE